MLIDSLMYSFYLLVSGILSFLPDLKVTIPQGVLSNVLNIFRIVGYFLPMGTVTIIITLSFAILGFRIAIAIIRFIRSFLPF